MGRVNRIGPESWRLPENSPEILPSFGYHPWYVKERTADWKVRLVEFLDQVPSAVGEIGLDRWIKGFDIVQQEEVFTWQLRLAAERDVAASIHCIEVWGMMLSILEREPRPSRGFMLHSYGGSVEMIPALAKLGAYFSLPGYYAHERKVRQRETFRHVPHRPTADRNRRAGSNRCRTRVSVFPLPDAGGKPVNHPANLRAVYEFAAELLDRPPEELAGQVESNFHRLFG